MEDEPSQPVMNAQIAPTSKGEFELYLRDNETTYRHYFSDYEQYTMFMMLPVGTPEQRVVLFNQIRSSILSDSK
jgi:hypothetical protein